MTPSGKMIPRRLQFDFASHLRNADQTKPLLRFGGWILAAGNLAVYKNGPVFWGPCCEYHSRCFFARTRMAYTRAMPHPCGMCRRSLHHHPSRAGPAPPLTPRLDITEDQEFARATKRCVGAVDACMHAAVFPQKGVPFEFSLRRLGNFDERCHRVGIL